MLIWFFNILAGYFMTASWVAMLGALLSSNCAAMPVGLGPTTEIHFDTLSLKAIDRHASPAHPITPMTNSAGQNRTNATGLAMKSNARRRFDSGARVPVVAV